jgi:hypothetical protein
MKHYKDQNGQVFAFAADGSQDEHIPGGLTPISDAEADALRNPPEKLASEARATRDALIDAVAWRYERHTRELRLILVPTDDIAALDAYVQALADVPLQAGFPSAIDWPVAP